MGEEPASATVTDGPEGPLVSIKGDLDGPDLRHITEAIVDAGYGSDLPVRVDLQGVPFMSSTGLWALILAQQTLDARGKDVHLMSASVQPRRLQATTAMEAYFHLAP
jgi:anti-sigma B factor antagonist